MDVDRRSLLSLAGRLGIGLGALLATAATGPIAACRGSRPGRRRHVLFVVVDDLNDWLGCLGHPVSTPNFDRLAARGVAFSRAYCAAPICNASRVATLSGLAPSTTGVYRNRHDGRRALRGKPALPHLFAGHGYGVIGGGKVYHHQDPSAWHRYYGRVGDPRPDRRPQNGIEGLGFDWGALDVPEDAFEDVVTAQRLRPHLFAAPDVPLFLAYGTTRPHTPWYVPPRYFDLYPEETIALPEAPPGDLEDLPPPARALVASGIHGRIVEAGAWRQAVRAYMAAISFADATVGRLLDALEASPRAGETVVVLCTDHGYHLGEKRHWGKGTLWERATRAPLIVAAPGVARPGAVCERVVSYLDIAPTILELCDIPVPSHLEGRSLVPLLREPHAARGGAAVSTWGHRNHSVRTESWRYTRYAGGSEELYAVRRDPGEVHNLAADAALRPRILELAQHLPAMDATPTSWTLETRDWKGGTAP